MMALHIAACCESFEGYVYLGGGGENSGGTTTADCMVVFACREGERLDRSEARLCVGLLR
jgi:hypothetical protein